MQKEAPRTTPKSRRFNRPAPGTPDRLLSASTEMLAAPRHRPSSRVTMAPSDFAVPGVNLFAKGAGLAGRKRLLSCRQSVMPLPHSQSFLDTSRRPEPENKDLEMKLLYDKYLQTTMTKWLMKKKSEEVEKAMITQLDMLSKEEEAIDGQLLLMKHKEIDLRYLMKLQDSIDNQIIEITACLEIFENKSVEILRQLQSMLQSLDILRCTNIIIPNTPEDTQKMHDLLAKCGNILKVINGSIGSKREYITTVNGGLNDFTRAHADVQDYAKKSEEALSSLQILVLKHASHSLCRDEF